MKNFNLLILTLLFGSYGSTLSMQSSGSFVNPGKLVFSAIERGDLDWLKNNISNILEDNPNTLYQKFTSKDGNLITPYALAIFRATNFFNAMNWQKYNDYIEIAKLLVKEGADLYGDAQADQYLSHNSSINNAINSVSKKRLREDIFTFLRGR